MIFAEGGQATEAHPGLRAQASLCASKSNDEGAVPQTAGPVGTLGRTGLGGKVDRYETFAERCASALLLVCQQASSACPWNSARLMAWSSAHHCPGASPSMSAASK